MKISTKGRYALRIMADIATHEGDKNVSIMELSTRNHISDKYLEQIISLLSKSGLVTGFRGSQGGYKLGRKPSEISVGEILKVTEGDLKTVMCVSSNGKCDFSKQCLTASFWDKLNRLVTDFFNSTTLDDIINRRV